MNEPRILRYFGYEHLPTHLQGISRQISNLAHDMVAQLKDTGDPIELETGLRQLLRAKDCFVRASLSKCDQ